MNDNHPPFSSEAATNPWQIPGAQITGSPALALFNDQLFLAHKGRGGNNNIYYTSTGDGENWASEVHIQVSGGCRMNESPAMAVLNGKLFLAHKGEGNSHIYYTSTSDGVNWAPEQIVLPDSAKISGSPALAVFNDQLFLAHKGAGDNNNIYYTSTYDGINWVGEALIEPNADHRTDESVAMVAFGPWLVLAHKGEHDANIYYTTFDGSNWAQEQIIPDGAQMRGTPSLASNGDSLFLAYAGLDSNYSTYLTSATAVNGALEWGGPGFSTHFPTWGSPACAPFAGFPRIAFQGAVDTGNLFCLGTI